VVEKVQGGYRELAIVITFKGEGSIGVNKHGTPCLLCPICNIWFVASRFGWHMKQGHTELHKEMVKQARKVSR